MENLGISLGSLIAYIINFIIVLLVLKAWVYSPLMKALQNRRAKIEKGLEDARIAAEARDNAEKDASAILAEAQANAAQVIREAKEKAEAAGSEVTAAVDADIAKARQDAKVEIEQERERVLGQIKNNVASLAIAAAQKLIGEALDEKRQHELVAEFFSGIKNGIVTVLEGAEFEGKMAQVMSALPLNEEEQKVITDEMRGKIGADAEVAFNVDPDILGGLVIRVGDKVVDGSVAGQIQNLRTSLQ